MTLTSLVRLKKLSFQLSTELPTGCLCPSGGCTTVKILELKHQMPVILKNKNILHMKN